MRRDLGGGCEQGERELGRMPEKKEGETAFTNRRQEKQRCKGDPIVLNAGTMDATGGNQDMWKRSLFCGRR